MYRGSVYSGLLLFLAAFVLLAACSSASRLRAWHKIDYRKNRKADKTARTASVNSSVPAAARSPDLINPVVVAEQQVIDMTGALKKKVQETRVHVEKVSKHPGLKKSPTRHPEYQEALEALLNVEKESQNTMSTADDALQQMAEQQKFVDKMYPPRDTLAYAAINSSVSNGSSVLVDSEEQFRSAIEKVDHTSQMAGAALFKAHVGMDKLVEKTNLAFDSIGAFTKAKSKDINGMMKEALKLLSMAKTRLSNARKRNRTIVEKLMQTEGNSKDISENKMVRKAAKNVRAAEEVVVRAENAVRESQSALKLAKRTDDASKIAKEGQSELKVMEKKANALTNKANEANIVANQDDLVEAALASKGDDEAATKLLTQNTAAHAALNDAYSAAMQYEPKVTTSRQATRKKEIKAFRTADAELDAEERAAIALEKSRADFLEKPEDKTFASEVVEKAKKEKKSDSEVDAFDYEEFKTNHSMYGDPIGFANSVMDELLKRAVADSDTGVLAPLLPHSYRTVDIPNSAAKLPDTDSDTLRAFDIANYARKCVKEDQLHAKKAAEQTKTYEQMVVAGSDNEPEQRMKVNVAQNIEEAIQKKLSADDDLLQATKQIIAALRYAGERKIKTEAVEHTVLQASTAVGIAHRELEKGEKQITDITDATQDQKLWTLRFKEAGAQQKLHKALLLLATESNITNRAEVDVIEANYKIAEAKLKRLQAIHAIRRHELKLNEDDPAPTMNEPDFGNSTEIMVAVHSAENEVAAQKKYRDAYVESVTLRFEAQMHAAALALKKSQALLTVAAVNSPGMTGASSLIMEGAATGSGPSESATGIALDQSSTGAGPQNSSAEGEYNPGVDSATGVSSGSSVDDAIDETEGSLEGDISRINALSEQVETYKRAARAAQKDADAGSNIILSEESNKAENDQLERTKPAKMPVSIMNQVLPRDGAKAARDVFEEVYHKPMSTRKVLEDIETQ